MLANLRPGDSAQVIALAGQVQALTQVINDPGALRAAVAHAEGTVDGDHGQLLAVGRGGGAADEGAREQQGEQQQHQCAQSEEEQVIEAAVFHRAGLAVFEKHQRGKQLGVGLVALEQVQPYRQPHRHRASQEPGREEAHYILPPRIPRYSRSAASSGRLVSIRK